MDDEPSKLQVYFARRTPLYERVHEDRAGLLARRWWRPLTVYRQRTMEALEGSDRMRIPEIGCGTGHLATDLAKKGAQVLGLDFTESMIQCACRRTEALGLKSRARFRVVDFDTWTPDNSDVFDCVLALAVFEYCQAPARWLEKIRRLGPEMIATFPLSTAWQMGLRKASAKVHGGFQLRFYSQSALPELLERSGFTIHRSASIGATLWVHARRTGT